MIDFVSGEVVSTGKDYVVVNVGGIGLRIVATKSVFENAVIGKTTVIHTHFAVREDAMTLYGFATVDERALFETLISVNGVGPKMGIAILSTLAADHLRNAVASENAVILTRVPGVGKKTAEKIIFELKGKMMNELVPGLTVLDDTDSDVLSALTQTFGFSVAEAQAAINSIPRDAAKDVETRIMLALQYFGK